MDTYPIVPQPHIQMVKVIADPEMMCCPLCTYDGKETVRIRLENEIDAKDGIVRLRGHVECYDCDLRTGDEYAEELAIDGIEPTEENLVQTLKRIWNRKPRELAEDLDESGEKPA